MNYLYSNDIHYVYCAIFGKSNAGYSVTSLCLHLFPTLMGVSPTDLDVCTSRCGSVITRRRQRKTSLRALSQLVNGQSKSSAVGVSPLGVPTIMQEFPPLRALQSLQVPYGITPTWKQQCKLPKPLHI